MDELIKLLNKAAELQYQKRYEEAATAIYEAECMARFIKNQN